MALSGNFTGTTNNVMITPKIVWSATQSTSGNYSTVTATLYYSRTNTGYTTYGSGSFSLTINGNTKSTSNTITITYNSNTQAISHTVQVPHNADGTKKVTISATGGLPGTSFTSTSISSTVTLNTIPRASTITSASSVTLGMNCGIKWTPAAKTFSYKLKFSLGSWSYTTGVIKPNTTAAYTYTGYTIPLSVANNITTAKTGTMTATLYSYSDSNGSTQIGTSAKTFTVTVPEVGSTPTVTVKLSVVDGHSGVYVQNKSKVKATITASGQLGATIKTCTMRVDGVEYAAKFSSAGVVNTEVTSDVIKKSSYITVSVTATDSRGFSTTPVDRIYVHGYVAPKILPISGETSVVCARCDANGNLSDQGTSLCIKAKREFTPLIIETADLGLTETNFCKLEYRLSSTSSWTEILAENATSDEVIKFPLNNGQLNITNTYEVQIRAVDRISEPTVSTFTIPTDEVYWHRDGARNAFAYHKYIDPGDSNVFDVAEDITFKARGPVEMPNFPHIQLNLIWKNQAHTSSFAAQTISLNIGEYDVLLISYKQVNTSFYARDIFIPKEYSGLSFTACDTRYDGGLIGVSRYAKCYFDTNKIEFGPGKQNATDNAAVMIPYRIYGIMGVNT